MVTIRLNGLRLGEGHPLFFIGGPCAIEGLAHAVRHARAISEICADLQIPYIYKASFDKANRTSGKTYRGPGAKKGLEILQKVKSKAKVPILTDVHDASQVKAVARVADVIQIPAFLCRQTDLIRTVARTGRVVNIKKGQFVDPWSMQNILQKATSAGNRSVMLTERGATFGYQNLVVDMRSIAVMRDFGYPVIMDAGHSVQQPGGLGHASGGMREMIPVLARAGIAAGAHGLFIEVHENPDRAPSDGPNMLKLKDLPSLLSEVKAIHTALHG